nr:hypothetical protein [Tanacetum cinerariifolium]
MTPFTFADTHNMVAFLSNFDASKGFDQIIDFLSAYTIQYALVVNPTIYVSCIKQFWATATIKKVNDVVQLRSLIDVKKVAVSEDDIRRDLHLDDADGVECFPNEEIFEELARMGYEKPHPKLIFYKAFFSAQWKFLIHTLVQCLSAKRTAWNEFSCSMSSVVICLATGRQFNFFKYIFDSMVRNVDNPRKFFCPRFLQVVMDNQVDNLTSHNTRYTSHALTQKVFANIRRVGKGFLGVETPLFALILVQPQPQAAKEGEEVEVPNAPAPLSPTNAPLPSPQDPTPTPYATPHASPPQEQSTLPHDSTMPLLTTLMETYASLSKKVAELEQDKHTQASKILKLKKRVKKLEKKKRSKSLGFKRLRRVGGKIEAIDADEDITLVDVEKDEELITIDAEPQGKINQEDVNAASKGVNVAEPTVFDDEETLFKPDKDVEEPKKKRVADETLLQESFKKLRAAEVSGSESTQEIPSNDLTEMSK